MTASRTSSAVAGVMFMCPVTLILMSPSCRGQHQRVQHVSQLCRWSAGAVFACALIHLQNFRPDTIGTCPTDIFEGGFAESESFRVLALDKPRLSDS
ncbi:hypothetical protein [Nocardia sp. MW-W600-9]